MSKQPVRRYFDDIQMATESGGRQFDKDGRPLVGRYRDGSTPPPNKRAYGAGQMQVATARSAAQRAGIKWDEKRFFSDREYNLNLADAHMKYLIDRYGDRTLARAAYHSGEGTVDKAIKRYGREGFAQGLGPEGRKYIKMGTNGAGGAYNSSSPGQGIASPEAYLADLESVLGPEVKASQNVKQQANAIFGSDEELQSRAAAVEQTFERQGQQLDVLDTAMEVAQNAAHEALTRQVEQTKDISNEIVTGTNELKDKVVPVFQARSRIADQLDKINSMNPLERGIRGIFDLNYDQDYLERQLDNYDRTLQARAADYDYLNKLHGVAMQEVERRYNLDTAIPSLLAKQAEEDIGLTGMRLTHTTGMLGSLREQVETETQLITAKALAREDLLLRLDTPTVQGLMAEAEQAGGIVKYNGVEFSYRELRDRIAAVEHQELQTEAYRMAIAGSRMDMAEKFAVNIAKSLTRSQLETAINNGGVYNGVQLPQDLLTDLFRTAVGRDEIRAEVATRSLPAKTALQIGSSYLNQSLGLYERGKSLFGNDAIQGGAPIMTQGAALVRRLTEATKNGEPPEVITALTQQIIENSNNYSKFIDGQILQRAGGDKRAAGYLKGFVTGSQLSAGTAAEALTYFAVKGNLPEGVALSPEASKIFKEAQAAVREIRDSRRPLGKKVSEQELISAVQERITKKAGRILGQARHDRIFSSLPQAAKAAGNPFGKLGGNQWNRIIAEAKNSAAEAVAAELQTTPDVVLRMQTTGKPVSNSESDKQLYSNWLAVAPKYNAVEMQTIVSLLDVEKPIVAGKPNSELMAEFMSSPQFSQTIQTYGQSLGSQSMAEYLVNPLAAGQTEINFSRTLEELRNAQANIYNAKRKIAQNPSTTLLLQPRKRTSMVLASIPEVGKHGAAALAPFVDSVFDNYQKNQGFSGFRSPNAAFMAEDEMLFTAMQTAKFEDPRLEAWRKAAVRGWKEHATAQQGFVSRMVEGLLGDTPNPYTAETPN